MATAEMGGAPVGKGGQEKRQLLGGIYHRSPRKEPLGEGSFAKVYEGMNKDTRELVAIKMVSWEKLERQQPRYVQRHKQQLRNEIACLQSLNHQNIVRLLHHQNTPKWFIMVLEFCAGGDLSQAIKRRKSAPVDERTARLLIKQLADGLQAMRDLNWVHRDLKPGNLLLTTPVMEDAVLKIGDFGFARDLAPESLAETWVGSPLYMAPEILTRDGGGYDAKADLWSVGCILFELVMGRQPYGSRAGNHMELIDDIKSDRKYVPDAPILLSEPCTDLLDRLLQRLPAQRLSYDEFFVAPWLGGSSKSAQSTSAGAGAAGSEQSSSKVNSLLSLIMSNSNTPQTPPAAAAEPQQGRTSAQSVKPQAGGLQQAAGENASVAQSCSPLPERQAEENSQGSSAGDFEMIDGYASVGGGGEAIMVESDEVGVKTEALKRAKKPSTAEIIATLPSEVAEFAIHMDTLISDVVTCTREIVRLANDKLREQGSLASQALVLYLWSLRILHRALGQLQDVKGRCGGLIPPKLTTEWHALVRGHLADDFCKAKLALRMGVEASLESDSPWIDSSGQVNRLALGHSVAPSAERIAWNTALMLGRSAAASEVLYGVEFEEARGKYGRALLLVCSLMLDGGCAQKEDHEVVASYARAFAERLATGPHGGDGNWSTKELLDVAERCSVMSQRFQGGLLDSDG